MKKRILAIALCVCMAWTGMMPALADGDASGDANGDAAVTPADAALLLRWCVGLDYRLDMRGRMLADVDCSGYANEEDAAQILRYLTGLSPLRIGGTDAALLKNLQKQYYYKGRVEDPEITTKWVTRFIQAMPESSEVRKVFYAAAPYMGTPYKQLDCSNFLKMAFRDAKIPASVYPQKSSNDTLKWFRTEHPEQLHETDVYSWEEWKPGCILIYLDQVTGEGNHLALYVGAIDGVPIVMESRNSGVDGVRLGYLMGEYTNKHGHLVTLGYYADPLG